MNRAVASFLEALRRRPDHPALVDLTGAEPRTISHGQYLAAASAVAARLAERGLSPGDRLGALLPNGADFALLYLACLLGGYTVVPLNPQSPEVVLAHAIGLARPRLVICLAETAGRLADSVPVWPLAPGEWSAASGAAEPCAEDANMLAIFFTSGTASKPKGVCHRAGGMLANVQAFNRANGLGPYTRMLHVMPMSYMAGFLNTLLSPLAAGGTVVLAPPFSAASALTFWKVAAAGDANAVWLTPTMLALLTQVTRDPAAPAWAEANLGHVFVGTAPLPPATRQGFEERFNVRCRESYGMTEVLLVAAQDPTAPQEGSVGRVLDGVAMEARAEDGTRLPPGQAGELWIDSPFACAGYLDPQTGAAPATDGAGWFPTGDVGRLDPVGLLFITDRKKDILIRGGTNISPRAVEEVLLGCEGIRDVAVIGIPHPFWGEEVAAVVELEAGAALDTIRPAAVALCRSELSADAVPSRWHVIAAFPRSSTGKIQKGELKSLFAQTSS